MAYVRWDVGVIGIWCRDNRRWTERLPGSGAYRERDAVAARRVWLRGNSESDNYHSKSVAIRLLAPRLHACWNHPAYTSVGLLA